MRKLSFLASCVSAFVAFQSMFAFAASNTPVKMPPAESKDSKGKSTLDTIKDKGELTIGIDPGFFPFEMRTKKGEWVGFDIDIIEGFAKHLEKKLGKKIAFKIVDQKWEGIIPALQAKKFDAVISGMTITDERSKAVLFSDPYYEAGLMAMISKSVESKVKSVKDLDSGEFSIVVKMGTTGEIYAEKNLKNAVKKGKLTKMDTEMDVFNSIKFGKHQATIYDKPYVMLYSKKNPTKVVALQEKISTEHFAMAARKKDKEFVDEFNAFLKEYKASGAYDKSLKKHFEEMPWIKDFPELK